MSNFYVGQKVVCIKRGGWIDEDGLPRLGPKFNEQCTIAGFDHTSGQQWLAILGYERHEDGAPNFYHCTRFRPLDSLTEQIERIETEGAPVELEPEYA